MVTHELRDGATGEQAIAVLRSVATNAGNLPGVSAGRSNDDLLNHYLSWAEEAERQLGNVFLADIVSDLVHTPTYWMLRTASGSSPRIIPMVLSEAEKRKQVLDELERAFKLELRRWGALDVATLVVPDTNMFLQEEEPFHELDWPKLADSRVDVRIVIPLVVIHELDRLKRQGNNTTKTLARTSLRWLHNNLPAHPDAMSAKLTDGFPTTTVEVYVQDVPSRVEDADGMIIRFARQLGRISERRTKLVTHDLGMRLRAAALGVAAVQLPG